MTPPRDLLARFDYWNGGGRKPQPAFRWNTGSWKKWLPSHLGLLDGLENPIDRRAVTRCCPVISDEKRALEAFLAVSVWGYGSTGYGGWRTRRILECNPAFVTDLLEFATLAQTEGGQSAFQYASERVAVEKGFFKHYGPAFATKLIYFATKASADVTTSPIMDSVASEWIAQNVPGERLYLGWPGVNSYRRYEDYLTTWAEELGIGVDDVEQLIFMPEPPPAQQRQAERFRIQKEDVNVLSWIGSMTNEDLIAAIGPLNDVLGPRGYQIVEIEGAEFCRGAK